MTQEKIAELKAKHEKIFKINVSNQDWYYRAMTREEFKVYSEKTIANADTLSQLDLEDMIFESCNLNEINGTEINNLPAGVIAVVSDAIMKATGFTENVEPEEL